MPYPGQPMRVRMTASVLNETTDVYDLTDPTAIVLTIEAPDGTETVYNYPGTITRLSLGRFYLDHVCSMAGEWKARVTSSGAVVAVEEAVWTILPSRVL